MSDFLSRWAASVLLAAALGSFGYWAGDHNRNNAWLARQALVERNYRLALETEVLRSNDAAHRLILAQQALQTNYSTLEGQFNDLRARGPLVTFRPGICTDAAPARGAAAVAGVAQAAAQPGSAPPTQAVAPAGVAAAGVGLTFGAVWMWNSALAGADTPAGACGAADTASAACAVDAGVDLDAAWSNHITNAQTCAEDRLRHQRLIDYITTAQGTAP